MLKKEMEDKIAGLKASLQKQGETISQLQAALAARDEQLAELLNTKYDGLIQRTAMKLVQAAGARARARASQEKEAE